VERYYIPYNEGCKSPASLLFVDTETDSQQLIYPPGAKEEQLRLWVSCHVVLRDGRPCEERWSRGKTADQFWAHALGIVRKKQPLTIIAHNAIFDLTILQFWRQVEEGLLRLGRDRKEQCKRGPKFSGKYRPLHGVMVLDSPPTVIIAGTRRGRLTFLDSQNWFRGSLRQLGDDIGLPKLSQPERREDDRTWFEHCSRDVEIVKRAVCDMITWIRDNDLGNWRYTAASQAFAAYRHRFCGRRIQIHRDPLVLALERAAFHAGETRCLFWGHVRPQNESIGVENGWKRHLGKPAINGPVFALDVSSLYPSVQFGHPYPCKLLARHDRLSVSELRQMVATHGVIASVRFRAKARAYPVRLNGETHWCTGLLDSTLTGPDLMELFDEEAIVLVRDVAVYELGDLFSGFVEFFYRLKESNRVAKNASLSLFYKICLNSLWGKFAQKQPDWVDVRGVAAPDPWGYFGQWDSDTKEQVQYRAIGWHVQQQQEGGEARYSFPAIAAYVTTYARRRMRTLRKLAGPRNVLYQDVDSLHVTQAGLDALVDREPIGPRTLGGLYRTATAATASYYGLKDYVLDNRHVCAGVPVNAKWILERQVECDEWERTESLLERGGATTVRIVPRIKTLLSCHVGGVVLPDGFVRPYELIDGQLR